MSLEPLWVHDRLIIPTDFLSVSFTRSLVAIDEDGEVVHLDGVEAARRQASAVELRLDVKRCTSFSVAQKQRIVAWPPLRADRRGVVRVGCGEFESRPKNLAAARERLAHAILDALEAPPEAAPAEERKKRGRGGLFKK
jgi:hypothetical protein